MFLLISTIRYDIKLLMPSLHLVVEKRFKFSYNHLMCKRTFEFLNIYLKHYQVLVYICSPSIISILKHQLEFFILILNLKELESSILDVTCFFGFWHSVGVWIDKSFCQVFDENLYSCWSESKDLLHSWFRFARALFVDCMGFI